MVRSQRARMARPAGGRQAVTRDDHQQHRPCPKIIVRLRPVLQDELARGETQSALTTTHRGEVKLKLEKTTRRYKMRTGEGFGDGKQQQREELLPTVFQVDTVLGPGVDTSEAYAAAASRLVDRAITGGKALLLIAGTPGSGRSHTLWGTLPQQHDSSATPVVVAAAGTEEQGLLPLALADLARRWSCGNGSPFYHSSSAAAATAGPRFFPSSSPTPADSCFSSPFAPPLAFRLCVAEVSPGGRENCDKEAGTTTSPKARDLLRGSSYGSPASTGGGGGDVGETKVTTSSRSPPRRWALSARDVLAGLASSSSASPPRSSLDPGGRRSGGGGGLKSRTWMGMGRGRCVVAAEGSLLTSRVLAGVAEVSAEGIEEALALIRKGLSKRRGEGHLVISAKLVTAGGNDTRVGPTPEGLTETGEMLFIELGDCPNDELPQTLRKALSHLKIGRDHQGSLELHQTPPASRLSRVAAVTGTTDASPILTKQRNGSNSRRPTDNSPPSNDPLWALLSAFAEPGPGPGGAGTLAESVVKGAAATAVATAAAAAAVVTGTAAGVAGFRLSFRHPTGRGAAATAATAEGAGTGGGGTATGDPGASAVASAGPLVVSVVATLRSGDAFYLEEKALLEALAKSSRTRPDSWRSLPLGRILVSMPSFSWWSSHPGPSAAAAAAAVAVANGSTPAPAPAAAPSAPPVPSSEEASLAMSNYSSSRSASSSFSDGNGEEASPATVVAVSNAAGGDASGDPSAGAEDDGFGSPTPSSTAANVTAEANGMDNAERSAPGGSSAAGGSGDGSRPHEASSPTHLEEASSDGENTGAGVLIVTGGQDELRRSESGRRNGEGGGGGGSGARLTIEGADEAADMDGAGAAKTSQKEARRLSPPWDDSTLGLLGLTQDKLIDRVLQAEKQSYHWKSQHALVERKLAALLASTGSRQTRSSGGVGGVGGVGGGGGTSRVPPMVRSATGLPGSASGWTAGRSPEHFPGCSPGTRTEGKNSGGGSEALTALPCGVSAGTADTTEALDETDNAQVRDHHGGAEGEGSGGGCDGGKSEETSDNTSASPGTAAVESAPGKGPPGGGGVRGGGVEKIPVQHESIADHLPRSRIVAADNSKNEDIHGGPPQPLTFKERRAIFSSNNSVPVPPAAASLPWSAGTNATVATGKAANPTPSSPRSSLLPRGRSCTSPPFTAFSSAAVEAARQNLKRSKIPSKRSPTGATRSHGGVAPGHLYFRGGEREGEIEKKGDGSCVSSDSRSPPQAEVSVSPVSLPQGAYTAAYSMSPMPCTPSRPLHHRRTTAPSPPAPSPCSTAERYRTTPGSPDSIASSARSSGNLSSVASSSSPWSSSFSSPAPPSTASSPQLASPPSFPKPNAERRRARARSAENENRTIASSASLASAILDSSATARTAVAAAAAAAAARLPPTAPSAVPRGGASPRAFAAAATSIPPALTSSGYPASPFAWSGIALRQKSVRLQHSSASFASAASSLPSPVPEEGHVGGAASTASRVAGNEHGLTGGVYYGKGAGTGAGGGMTEEVFSNSKGLAPFPPSEAAGSCMTNSRSGGSGGDAGGGGGGKFEDDWNERPAGVGPWPLFERTREGKASLDEKHGVRAGGAIGAGTGRLTGGGADEAKMAAPAATEAAAEPEVSIGNISTMQASRLRALREKMERRYWPRETASKKASTATSANLVGNTDACAVIPEGSKSLDRLAHRDQSQTLVAKPWGSRQGAMAHRTSM